MTASTAYIILGIMFWIGAITGIVAAGGTYIYTKMRKWGMV